MKSSFLKKNWNIRGIHNPRESLLDNVLRIRGFSSRDFPMPRYEDLADPFLFSQMEKVVDRVLRAIKKRERILIFGDYDVDGMSSVAMVFKTLHLLGAEVSFRLPSRSDGYGLSEGFIQEAVENDVRVLITTDCGISNMTAITKAKDKGIDVIISDHHSVPENCPPAYGILHPLLPQESFPDDNITGAGVAFFLCFALLRKKFRHVEVLQLLPQLLELAALGTVADCGAMLGQNRLITLLGITSLKNTKNSGLRQLFKTSRIDPQSITAETIGFFIAPRLNAAGRLDHPRRGLELLLGNHKQAEKLESLNSERQLMVERFLEKAEAIIEASTTSLPAIVVVHKDWTSGVIGLIAGKLSEKYNVPAIVFEQSEFKMTASCRGPEDFHFMECLREVHTTIPNIFLSFGGHKTAAGFSLLPRDFEKFRMAFLRIVRRKRGGTPPAPDLNIDFKVTTSISMQEAESLQKCEPFGMQNPFPCLVFPHMKIMDVRKVGSDGKHLSLELKNAYGKNLRAIFFGQGNFYDELKKSRIVDAAAFPEVQTWNGTKSVQLKVADIRIVS